LVFAAIVIYVMSEDFGSLSGNRPVQVQSGAAGK
jgi:hypothetical protein